MMCGQCSSDAVTWRGPLTDLTHSECSACGSTDCHIGVEEGQECRREGCRGIIEYLPDQAAGCCSCHITAPCGYCTSTMPECPECGWRDEA